MRTEMSADGEEIVLRIPVRVFVELIRPRLALGRVDAVGLSARERAVFVLLRSGKVNKEIAAGLNVSLSTVKFHIANIYRKVGVSGRGDLFRMYGE